MANPSSVTIVREGLTSLMQYALDQGVLRIRLVTGTALVETSAIGDVATNELAAANGYPAGGLNAANGTSAYDASDDRIESLLTATLTASGGALTWRQAAITLEYASGSLLAILTWTADETLNDGETTTFNVKINAGKQGTTVDLVDT